MCVRRVSQRIRIAIKMKIMKTIRLSPRMRLAMRLSFFLSQLGGAHRAIFAMRPEDFPNGQFEDQFRVPVPLEHTCNGFAYIRASSFFPTSLPPPLHHLDRLPIPCNIFSRRVLFSRNLEISIGTAAITFIPSL